MDSWRKVAADKLASSHNATISPPPERKPLEILTERIERLSRDRAPPKVASVADWSAVMRDAVRLIRDGWAEKALALGWTDLDLFGVGAKDSWDFSGLAVWLQGRELLALTPDDAVVRTETGRAWFRRQGWGHGKDADSPTIPLWEFGR